MNDPQPPGLGIRGAAAASYVGWNERSSACPLGIENPSHSRPLGGLRGPRQLLLHDSNLHQSFSSFARISFIISDAPAPIVLSRESRQKRLIGYSVVYPN